MRLALTSSIFLLAFLLLILPTKNVLAFTRVDISAPKALFTAPDHGPVTGGKEVIIVGVNFQAKTKVIWANQEIPATFIDSGFLRVISPSGVPGDITIKVINPDGGSDELLNAYTYEGTFPAPKVTLITPQDNTTLSAGGEATTINWQIESAQLTSQKLLLSTDGGSTFPVVISDNLSLDTRSYIWVIPPDLITNNARVKLEAAALDSLGSATNQQDLKIVRAPEIKSLVPATIRANTTGFDLTINGDGFTKGLTVEIDGKKYKSQQITDSSITIRNIMSLAPGAHFIRVRNRNRTISFRYLFTVAQ